MKFFRKLITYRKLGVFLAVGMLLRSTIAVGYMLDTNPANGDLFSVTICEGPAGINAIPGFDNQDHNSHQNHAHHGHGDDDAHEHAAQDHPITSCSFWSSSSLSLFVDILETDNSVWQVSNNLIDYQDHHLLQTSFNTRFARAPPALS